MISGTIFDIKRFALHDGPGTRTTVFLKGCPLSCRWCHNPEGISTQAEIIYHENRCLLCGDCVRVCPEDCLSINENRIRKVSTRCTLCARCVEICPTTAWETSGRSMQSTEVIEQIERDILFFEESRGGVTFSGGEPMLQIDFLEDLLKTANKKGLHTAVDTSGFAPSEHFRRISNFTDLFLYDLKCMNDQMHIDFTSVSNRIIHENFRLLSSIARDLIVRIPVIPDFNATPVEIAAIGDFVFQNSKFRRIDLLPYHHMAIGKFTRLNRAYDLQDAKAIDPLEIDGFKQLLAERGFDVTIGG